MMRQRPTSPNARWRWGVVIALAAIGALALGGPFKRDKTQQPSVAQPTENLLIIVADIQRHLADDVYRYPYPQDFTGQNIFRAALIRLANYETLYPKKLPDIVSLAKAQAFEKLTAYEEALANYEKAAKSSDPNIAKSASEGAERMRRFIRVVRQSLDRSGLRTYERDLSKLIRDLDDLVAELKGTHSQCLALLERERAQLLLAEFYVTMRFIQPYTTDDALAQLRRNIEQNKDSKQRYRHRMMLADFYFELATQYMIKADPDGPNFDMRQFEGYANAARSEYDIISRADGFPQKAEARAKLLAVEALVQEVTERAR
ncbi:MAG: hypothetical protein ACP5QZ_04155 [Candidatus Sumerlaeaceae bacterium]